MTQQLASRLKKATPRRLTYAQFLKSDSENQHVEWVEGKVVPMAPVSGEHQLLSGFLISILRAFIESSDLGELLHDPFQMKTGSNLPGRAPDLIFIARKNLARLKKNYLDGPADLVVEIISEGNRGVDRGDKFYEYERGGVREYWLIDPIRKQAEFYSRGRDGHYKLVQIADDRLFYSGVLKGLWIDVAWLWKRPSQIDVLKQWKLV